MGLNQVFKDAPVVSSICKVLRSGWLIRHQSHCSRPCRKFPSAAREGASAVSEVESAASVMGGIYANVQVGDGLLLSSTVIFPTLVRCSFWNRVQLCKVSVIVAMGKYLD